MAIGFYESRIFDFEEGITARANTSVSSGKWYWEVTIARGIYWDSSIVCVGVGTSSVLPQQVFTETIHGWGIDSRGIARHAGKGDTQVLPAYRNANPYGEVTIGIALDMDLGYLWGIVADEWGRYDQIGDPEAGTDPHISGITGTVYPMVSLQLFDEDSRKNTRITANFGKTPFKHTMPSGYDVLEGPSSSSSSSISSSSRSMSSSSVSSSSSSIESVSSSSSNSSSSVSSGYSSFSSYSIVLNAVKTAQVLTQVEALESGNVKVPQVLTQVEAMESDNVRVPQVLTQVEAMESDDVKVPQVLVQVEVVSF
jgi:hypothetical protein